MLPCGVGDVAGEGMITRVLIVLALLLPCGCARAETGQSLDRSRLELSFEETFRQPPSFYQPGRTPAGRWKTNYFFSIQDTAHPRGWESRTLQPNDEMEYYGDPLAGMDPFRWDPGHLDIIADRNPRASDPLTGRLPFFSGLITTEKSFSQLYGYFEARIRMPVGKGLWPAFWLLPQPAIENGWPREVGRQEIDVVENIGAANEVYLTVHRDDGTKKVADGEKITGVRVDQPHTYGVLVTREAIVWYIDDREVRRRPNVDFHFPAYMLLNLAVGGKWPGAPDQATRLPATMRVEWVRAWRLNR